MRGVPKCPEAAMRTLPLAPSLELLWGHDPREGCAAIARGRYANPTAGAFGGAPYGATILVRGVPKWPEAAMRTLPLGAFGGAPYGATILEGGVPKWPEAAMRTLPLAPSVELPMGPRSS